MIFTVVVVVVVDFIKQVSNYFFWKIVGLWWEWVLHILRELLLGLVSTNTTRILQARKQMECDNNDKRKETSNLINKKQYKNNLKFNVHFMCVCVYVENTALASWIKIYFHPCVCVCVSKVYWINVSILVRSK